MTTRLIFPASIRFIFSGGVWLRAMLLGTAAVLRAQSLTGHDLADLGSLASGGSSAATDIDDAGRVVGFSQVSGPSPLNHAFFYASGTMTDLGSPGFVSTAAGLNNSGQVVGRVFSLTTSQGHAFLHDRGTLTDLGTLGGANSFAAGINASGQIVGASEVTTGGPDNAFLYAGGRMTNLGTLGGNYSQAYGINDAGQVVGFSNITNNIRRHAFLWENGTMTDLGTLGGTALGGRHSQARGINASGQVVGFSQDVGGMGYHHACLFSGGTITDLGTLGGDESEANALNDAGLIVGASDLNGHTVRHAFVHWQGAMYDLNTALAPLLSNGITPGFTSLTTALAVNADWQVVGIGDYFDGTAHHPQRAFRVSVAMAPPARDWTRYVTGTITALVVAIIASLLVVGARRRRP